MDTPELHIGVVGAGEFSKFAITAFLRLPGIKVVAVTDINPDAARRLGTAYNLVVYADFEQLLKNAPVQLIYIATPPYLHFAQSRLALLAGKHVICEKPAALKTSEAETLAKLAEMQDLLYVVNLMQRYNPLYNILKQIVDERLLGDFRHGFFENYASDEFLGPQHWFWDQSKSGGIFIEHGVHFFDLFSGWLGEGKLLAAFQLQRHVEPIPPTTAPIPPTTAPIPAATQPVAAGVEPLPADPIPSASPPIIDRVQATVMYKTGPVNFYHGFDQPKILDRQEMRLLFERGEITLFEWVPVRMRLHGLVGASELQRLEEMTTTSATAVAAADRATAAHPTATAAHPASRHHITLDYENPAGKQDLYQQMLTAMLSDQWSWIKDRTHIRVIDDHNAVASLKMAEEATGAAQTTQTRQCI
jgi:hypothetical protein